MASFVDRAHVKMKAGNGGSGSVSFHREKYVLNGGPDGGDGGKGGDVVLIADGNMHTLLDFRFRNKHLAQDGQPGDQGNCTGKSGEDLIVRVPVGTVVRDKETGDIVADMATPDKHRVLLHGGRGGWGNAHFATPTRQAPNFAKPGVKTELKELILELRTIADVGLVGFPNVGKSSLLSVVTRAKPKIANYPFTTLTPNLGMASVKGVNFVMADIPGLIENASQGAGLGFNFLRHVERTRLLIHVVDVSGIEDRDPVDDFRIINQELKRYGDLDQRPTILAANKMDLPGAAENLERLKEAAGDMPVFPISAATRAGIDALLDAVAEKLSTLPPVYTFEETEVDETPLAREYTVTVEDDAYVLKGPSIDSLIASVNFEDYESLNWFQRTMRKSGIINALREKGCTEGDTVRMGDMEFDFVE